MEDLLELLDLLRRDLGAVDARLEIGGQDPKNPRLVHRQLEGGYRVVAVFDRAPDDRPAVERRLAAFLQSFTGFEDALGRHRPALLRAPVGRRLDKALGALCGRAKACVALVLDDSSPVVWGCSLPELGRSGVAGAFDEAHGPEPELAMGESPWRSHHATARAVVHLRDRLAHEGAGDRRTVHHGEGFGYLARGFGGIYVALLTFDAPFSELAAEGAMVHALPGIERLVRSLPPVDPTRQGGRLYRLDRKPAR